jgi:two-component system, NarL family, nitrate/nitrite response regulator NarL
MNSDDIETSSILIVDGDRLFAEALRRGLHEFGVHVVEIAESLPEGLGLVRKTRPDLMLVDTQRAVAFGSQEGEALRERSPGTATLSIIPSRLLDGLFDADRRRRLISKDASMASVLEAIGAALADLARVGAVDGIGSPAPGGEEELTDRERDVLRLLASGLSNKAMAERLGISTSTVNTHVRSVMRKLRVRSRLGAAARAHQQGLVEGPGARRRNTRSA